LLTGKGENTNITEDRELFEKARAVRAEMAQNTLLAETGGKLL